MRSEMSRSNDRRVIVVLTLEKAFDDDTTANDLATKTERQSRPGNFLSGLLES